MKHLSFSRLKSVISSFKQAKVLVVGDLILDEFIWGSVSRISPEAPVPVVWVDSENFMPGGASNVANNIRALDGEVFIAGIVGEDARGEILQSQLRKRGIFCEGIFVDSHRPTTQKTRVIAHHQQVVRIDRETVHAVPEHLLKQIIGFVRDRIKEVDAVIIEDYGKGVIVPRLVKEIVKIAKKHDRIITVDPKETHFAYYKGVTTITPNHHEAASAVGFAIKDEASLRKAGKSLLQKLRCESVLITLGENGMALFVRGKPMEKIPTIAKEVFDVSGAGDTVIGTYTLARACKATPVEAAHVSNCAGGIVVGKVGVATTSAEELLQHVHNEIHK
ncbi:MAG: D-glycero-beta-D-manno-heptose-7-phosphate kinase [Candidatus Omnitrophota bacterium]